MVVRRGVNGDVTGTDDRRWTRRALSGARRVAAGRASRGTRLCSLTAPREHLGAWRAATSTYLYISNLTPGVAM